MKRKSNQSNLNGKEGQEPATKADVAAVKSELKADVAAVKSDLAAVKSELKADVAAVRSDMAVMKSVLEFKIEDSIRDAKQEIIERMDKLVNHVDAVFVEMKTSREEQAALAHHSQDHDDRLENHDKRITKLEVKVGGRAG